MPTEDQVRIITDLIRIAVIVLDSRGLLDCVDERWVDTHVRRVHSEQA